mgnify:CR=1 FL=1
MTIFGIEFTTMDVVLTGILFGLLALTLILVRHYSK